MLTLCPDCVASSLSVAKKFRRNQDYYNLYYYVGFERKCVSGYFSEEELQKHIEEINKIKNKFTDTFTIDKQELTPDIIKHFRYVEPVIEYPEQEVLIDPYILGLWLGDGNTVKVSLTNIDIPIINAWKEYAEKIDCKITTSNEKERTTDIKENETSNVMDYNIIGREIENGRKGKVKEIFKQYNLIGNKHIPIQYLENSTEVRLKVLAGLIDTDGYLTNSQYEITQKSKILADNIVVLCKSLGFYTQIKEVEKSCMYKDVKRVGKYFRIYISMNQFTPEVPVLLERKKWKYNEQMTCNPIIDINGNIIQRVANVWTEEMKIKLYSIAEKIKEIQPDKCIPWVLVKDFDETFKNMKPDVLRNMYSKKLLSNKEYYEIRKIDITINEYSLISEKWRTNYEKVKEILDSGQYLSYSKNKQLHNWLRKQKNDRECSPSLYQQNLWNELIKKQQKLYEESKSSL